MSCTIMICDNIGLLMSFFNVNTGMAHQWVDGTSTSLSNDERDSQTDRQTDRPKKLTCHWSVLFLDMQEMMHALDTVKASQCIVWTYMNPCCIFSTLCCQFFKSTLTERPATTFTCIFYSSCFLFCMHIHNDKYAWHVNTFWGSSQKMFHTLNT